MSLRPTACWHRTPEQRAERDRVIIEGRLRGETHIEIAKRLGITPSRVCTLAKRLERAGVLPSSRGPRTWGGYGTVGTTKFGVRVGSMREMLAELPWQVYANLCAMAADNGATSIAEYLRRLLVGLPELQTRLPSRSALRLEVLPGGKLQADAEG